MNLKKSTSLPTGEEKIPRAHATCASFFTSSLPAITFSCAEKGWLAYYSKPTPPYHDQKHYKQRYDTALAKTY